MLFLTPNSCFDMRLVVAATWLDAGRLQVYLENGASIVVAGDDPPKALWRELTGTNPDGTQFPTLGTPYLFARAGLNMGGPAVMPNAAAAPVLAPAPARAASKH